MSNSLEPDSLSASASQNRGSVEKAIDILVVFRNHPSGLGVSEVARLTKLPKTTSHRLLNTLAARGALERSGDVFRLGPVIFDIVSSSSGSIRANLISEVVTPFLASLFEQTRHTVHLAYLEGNDVAYANKLFSTKRLNSPSRIGGRAPSYCTGVGKVLLAHDSARAELVCPASSRHGRPTALPILQNCVQSFSTSELKVLHLTVRKFRWVYPVSQPRSSA